MIMTATQYLMYKLNASHFEDTGDEFTNTWEIVGDILESYHQYKLKNNVGLGDFNHVPDWMPPLAVDHAEQLMKSGKRFAALKHILIFAKSNVDNPIKWCADFIEARSRLQRG